MTDIKNKAALFKYGLIAPVINNTFEDKHKTAYFERIVKEVKVDYLGRPFKVSQTTLCNWLNNYKKNGFEGLIPSPRNDRGKFRVLDYDVEEEIAYIKKEYPRVPATVIYEKLIANGTITKKDLSLSTVTRYINKIKRENNLTNNKDMRRYESPEINHVWCGDSSHLTYFNIDGRKVKLYAIALIDDASRFIVGVNVFSNDNTINLISVIKSAVLKYGKPKIFNFDNGSNYKNNQIELLSARIGSTIRYCAPFEPESKSKIERWFRTLKDHWLASININDYKDIESIRRSLFEYVNKYNNTIHSSLNNKSPQIRFFEQSELIKRINEDDVDKLFLLEIERKVSIDSVIVINGIEYEVPYHYAKQRIKLRYNGDLTDVFISQDNKLTPIKLLNKHENAFIKREKIKYTGGND